MLILQTGRPEWTALQGCRVRVRRKRHVPRVALDFIVAAQTDENFYKFR